MVENRKKHRQNSHLMINFLTSEGVSEVSERANERAQLRAQSGASKRVSGVSDQANRRASGLVLQSVFFAVLDHNVLRILFLLILVRIHTLKTSAEEPVSHRNTRSFFVFPISQCYSQI